MWTHCSLFPLGWLFVCNILKLLRTAAVAALPVVWGSAGLSPGWVVTPAHVLDANAGFPAVSPCMHVTPNTESKINPFNSTY